jgi:hypothetical protein
LQESFYPVTPCKTMALDSAGSVPVWQRHPIRVSFEAGDAPRQTFSIRGQVVDVVNDADVGSK